MTDENVRVSAPVVNPAATAPSTGKPRKRWLLPALVILALIAAGAYWHHVHAAAAAADADAAPGGKHGKNNMPTSVQAAHVISGDINVNLDALGTVIPSLTVTVHSLINGQLMKVWFKEGDTVKAGQALVDIDDRPYVAALNQAEGQLAHDQALLANARKDMARYNTLVAQNSVSSQIADTQVALVKQYEGTVKVDQGQVATARLNVEYCHIKSPIDGKVGLRLVDPGNQVHTSDTTGLVVVNKLRPIYVEFAIPQVNLTSVLVQLHAGKTLPVIALDRDQKTILANGQLLSLDNQIDTTTGTLKAKAQFANADDMLFPNQFVNARLVVERRTQVAILPTAAIQRGSQGTYVYVIDAASKVQSRPVTLGPIDADQVQILSGVQVGEQVVIDGADKLKNGGRVRIIVPGQADAAGKAGGHHQGAGSHKGSWQQKSGS